MLFYNPWACRHITGKRLKMLGVTFYEGWSVMLKCKNRLVTCAQVSGIRWAEQDLGSLILSHNLLHSVCCRKFRRIFLNCWTFSWLDLHLRPMPLSLSSLSEVIHERFPCHPRDWPITFLNNTHHSDVFELPSAGQKSVVIHRVYCKCYYWVPVLTSVQCMMHSSTGRNSWISCVAVMKLCQNIVTCLMLL